MAVLFDPRREQLLRCELPESAPELARYYVAQMMAMADVYFQDEGVFEEDAYNRIREKYQEIKPMLGEAALSTAFQAPDPGQQG